MIAAVSVLAGCKDKESAAREDLSAAMEHVLAAERAEDALARYEALGRAQALLQAIPQEYPGTQAALDIASGAVIGTVPLTDVPRRFDEARRARDILLCAQVPGASCLLEALVATQAEREGVAPEVIRAQLPPEVDLMLELMDAEPSARNRWQGQTRPADDREVFQILYTVAIERGREGVVRDWMEATVPAPGSEIGDWASFVRIAAENRSGRNLVQTEVTRQAVGRILAAEGESAAPLVLALGGVDEFEALLERLGRRWRAEVEGWRERGLLRAGSDGEGLLAIALWNRGEREAAREIFVGPAMAGNDFVLDSLPRLAPPEARAELLRAALPAAGDPRDLYRIAFALIAQGGAAAEAGLEALRPAAAVAPDLPDAGSAPGQGANAGKQARTVPLPVDLASQQAAGERSAILRFAEDAARALGEAGDEATHAALLELVDGAGDAELRDRVQAGWQMGGMLAGDVAGARATLEALPVAQRLEVSGTLLWHLLDAGRAGEATQLYEALGLAEARADVAASLRVRVAILAGDFAGATRWLGQVGRGDLWRGDTLLRKRLAHQETIDEAALMPLLVALEPHVFDGAAAMLAQTDRFVGQGFALIAARYALSREGEGRLRALSGLLRVWPGAAAAR